MDLLSVGLRNKPEWDQYAACNCDTSQRVLTSWAVAEVVEKGFRELLNIEN